MCVCGCVCVFSVSHIILLAIIACDSKHPSRSDSAPLIYPHKLGCLATVTDPTSYWCLRNKSSDKRNLFNHGSFYQIDSFIVNQRHFISETQRRPFVSELIDT